VSALLRLITLNVLTSRSADGPRRHRLVREQLAGLDADVIALQEVRRTGEVDEAQVLVGDGYALVDVPGGHPEFGGECLATRLPVRTVHTLDQPLGPDHRASAVAVEILGPGDLGPVLVVHHKGTYELHREDVRELQALATARFVEGLVAGRPLLPVVLLGDFNAAPDSAGLRFLTGRQSLDGFGVRYDDAWELVHGASAGHTFDPANPIVRQGQMPSERGRRIDYVLTRSGPHGPLLEAAACRVVLDEPVDGVWPSDHFGVLADLVRPPHPPGEWQPAPP
jgi:endonuclease/exonuclease/phosphatase family metal-dependent hydrolase